MEEINNDISAEIDAQLENVPELSKEEIDKKLTELKAKKEELKGKFYLIEGGKEYGEKLRAWLINDAKWNYSECVAIVKLSEAVGSAIKRIAIGEAAGKLYMLGIELKAINMMFQKYEGKGWHSANKFNDILMPILNVVNSSVRIDDQAMEVLDFQIASWSTGVEPAPEIEQQQN